MSSKASRIDTAEDAVRFEDELFSYTGQAPRRKPSPKGGALPGIVDTLYSEHRYIQSLLDILDSQSEKLVPGKIPNYHLMLDVLDYLTHYPDQYHHPREDLLFGSLLRQDKGFRKHIERLEREHETVRTYNEQLFGELRAIASGRPVAQSQLRDTLQRYVNGYRKHMDFEAREVFPRASGKLSKSDLAKLDASTRYIDDPIFGGVVQKRFRRLARSLESAAGELGLESLGRCPVQLDHKKNREFFILLQAGQAGN